MGVSHPHSPAKKEPKALSSVDKTPGTFSQRILDGSFPASYRISSIASANLTNCSVKFPLSSDNEPLNPAIEKAWHGVPPTNKSALPIQDSSLSVVKSPYKGTSG